MTEKKFVCIECPRGCELRVTEENGEIFVQGNFCPRGKKYAETEVREPKRILTSSVKTQNGRVSVKTDGEVKKSELFELMKKIREVKIDREVYIGDVIIENIDGNGNNLVATSNSKN